MAQTLAELYATASSLKVVRFTSDVAVSLLISAGIYLEGPVYPEYPTTLDAGRNQRSCYVNSYRAGVGLPP